jgi:pyridoxal 5'-phosphate synthase glutaminase subunit Pdx2
MGLVAERWGLVAPLKAWVQRGKPTWGTCAGMILLAARATGQKAGGQPLIGGLDVTVNRNYFGRQADSFETLLTRARAWATRRSVPSSSARRRSWRPASASMCSPPRQTALEKTVVVAVQQDNLLATAFHPELTDDPRWHAYFVLHVMRHGRQRRGDSQRESNKEYRYFSAFSLHLRVSTSTPDEFSTSRRVNAPDNRRCVLMYYHKRHAYIEAINRVTSAQHAKQMCHEATLVFIYNTAATPQPLILRRQYFIVKARCENCCAKCCKTLMKLQRPHRFIIVAFHAGRHRRRFAVVPLSCWPPRRHWRNALYEIAYTGCGGTDAPVVNEAYEARVVELVNEARAANGNLPPLRRIPCAYQVSALSRHRSRHTDNYFNHDTYDRSGGALQRVCGAFERMRKWYSYDAAGENIAAGYGTPEEVMAGWMRSDGHRENILDPDLREIGVGYYQGAGDYGVYWVQNLGARSDEYPLIIANDAATTSDPNVAVYVHGDWGEMRLRNDSGAWSEWQPFQNRFTWALADGAGEHILSAELRSGATTHRTCDKISLDTRRCCCARPLLRAVAAPVAVARLRPPLLRPSPLPRPSPTINCICPCWLKPDSRHRKQSRVIECKGGCLT